MLNNRLYDIYKKRLNIFKVIISVFVSIILIKFFFIQVIFNDSYKDQILAKTKTYKAIQGDRGRIYDRNNELLAVETKKCTFWTNTNESSEEDRKDIVELFSKEFPESKILYKKLLDQNKEYLVIEDALVSYYHDDLINYAKNIESLRIDYNNHRLYPYNELAAQVIGFTDKENKGKYGIEKFFDNILSGSREIVQYNKTASGKATFSKNTILPKNGSDIFLTIDINIQDILQKQLLNTVTQDKAKSANGIIVNPYNGEIIAMASIPDFNLNDYQNVSKDSPDIFYKNRVISHSYEPGSTFKIICFSEALDSDLEKINKKYYCEKGRYKGKYIEPFEDHIKDWDSLNFHDIFIRSSNIGTVKIFEDLSKISFYNRIKKFGFGIKSNISLPDESSGKIKDFKNYLNNSRDLASIAIGQSILVTNLQMAMAYSSIANGGYLLKPKIIQKIDYNGYSEEFNKPIILNNNINIAASKLLLPILEKTVIDPNGTAMNAYTEYIRIGGKTGTGEIWDNDEKKYSNEDFFSSFVSIFPINDPKYVMIISIEAPIYEKRWGSQSAVPCSKKIIEDIILYDKDLMQRLDKINEKA